jgi:hypothetical protein
MSQKIVQYQAVLQLSQTAPQIYDLPHLHRQMIETLGVKNADKIIPLPDDAKPRDPITENMDLMTGKPTKVFMYQDHEAHMQVHMALMQDPKIAAVIGQSPQAQQMQAAIQAHVMEHMAFQYRREIEKQLGAALPPLPQNANGDYDLPPEFEAQLSQLAAVAAARVLQKGQAEAQQQQAQQQQQDPLVQMQQMDLQIKQLLAQTKAQQAQMDGQIRMAEQQRKTQKDMVDAAAKLDELELRKAESSGRQQLEAARLGVDIQKDKAALAAKQQIEGVRLGLDIGKARDDVDMRRKQTEQSQQPEGGSTEV